MPTITPSQAEQAATLLETASQSLLDAFAALSDLLELAEEPDGVVDPREVTLALVGRTTVIRRHVEWVGSQLAAVERAMLEQNDYAREGTDASC